MSDIRTAAIFGLAIILGACSIGKPLEQVTTFALEPALPARMPEADRKPESVRMGQVQVAAAFAGPQLVYRMDDVRYTADPYNAFLADPAGMFGAHMAQWLDRAGPYRHVTQPGSARTAPFLLEATITELYGDFRPGQTPAAVLTVQFALIDMTDPRTVSTFEQTITRRASLERATPDALVRGFNQALDDVLKELVSGM
jgi:uncharacterized lipoprotein YmbA